MRQDGQHFVRTRSLSHPSDSQRMRALSCDCREWCMGWYLSQLVGVRSGCCLWSSTPWHRSQQSCPAAQISLLDKSWEKEKGKRKTFKSFPCSGKCTTSTALTTYWSSVLRSLLLYSTSFWCWHLMHCCAPVWPNHWKIWRKNKKTADQMWRGKLLASNS